MTKTTTKYEVTYMCNGKPAGYGGLFDTRQEAESLRRHAQLSLKIKRVRIPV